MFTASVMSSLALAPAEVMVMPPLFMAWSRPNEQLSMFRLGLALIATFAWLEMMAEQVVELVKTSRSTPRKWHWLAQASSRREHRRTTAHP